MEYKTTEARRLAAYRWKQKNVERARQAVRDWRNKNPEKQAASKRKWDEKNPGRRTELKRLWRKNNPDKVREESARQRRKSPLLCRMRSYISGAVKGTFKAGKTLDLLGCEISALCWYLEAQFKGGMSWENYGKVWEIDHVIPASWWDLTDPFQQEKCFHFSNLQPEFISENRSKQDRYVVR